MLTTFHRRVPAPTPGVAPAAGCAPLPAAPAAALVRPAATRPTASTGATRCGSRRATTLSAAAACA